MNVIECTRVYYYRTFLVDNSNGKKSNLFPLYLSNKTAFGISFINDLGSTFGFLKIRSRMWEECDEKRNYYLSSIRNSVGPFEFKLGSSKRWRD